MTDNSSITVLICDDHATVHETLGKYLKSEGFSWISAFDGEQALSAFRLNKVDFVILDQMMPGKSGFEVCREIRRHSSVPIIMLTAMGEEADRVSGIELGADDYIVKPFSPREVIVRIKAILRRVNAASVGETTQPQVLRFGELEINLDSYEVSVAGKNAHLTPREVEMLYFLAARAGRVLPREQILSHVWGLDFDGDTRVVDTQIKRIRQKLPQDSPDWSIKSIYGVGYKFEAK